MLTVPASNVSVPLAVVMRTLSRVAAVVLFPDVNDVRAWSVCPIIPVATHKFELIFNITRLPERVLAADAPSLKSKPLVKEALVTEVTAEPKVDPAYPEVSTDPPPIWIRKLEVPFVDTP